MVNCPFSPLEKAVRRISAPECQRSWPGFVKIKDSASSQYWPNKIMTLPRFLSFSPLFTVQPNPFPQTCSWCFEYCKVRLCSTWRYLCKNHQTTLPVISVCYWSYIYIMVSVPLLLSKDSRLIPLIPDINDFANYL